MKGIYNVFTCIYLIFAVLFCHKLSAVTFPNAWQQSSPTEVKYFTSESIQVTIDFLRVADSSNEVVELKHEDTTGKTTSYFPVNTHTKSFYLEEGMHSFQVEYCQEDPYSGDEECKSNKYILNVLVSPSPEVLPTTLFSKLAHYSSVSSTGDAQIKIPLKLVPGVAGFSPSFALSYNSGRPLTRLNHSMSNTTLGYGWMLTGLSEIRRCVVNKSTSAVINLTSSDNLCLDSVPLRLASGVHLQNGAIYRTELESFTKIMARTYAGRLWFEVYRPNGTVQEYGRTTDSEVVK